mmetsp:Transcript_48273/g.96638  ORF Transcript_48273/g.96638 Transcript_48273/m.96638 type:complete len:225 (+) Transcript_48273:169-843(+)
MRLALMVATRCGSVVLAGLSVHWVLSSKTSSKSSLRPTAPTLDGGSIATQASHTLCSFKSNRAIHSAQDAQRGWPSSQSSPSRLPLHVIKRLHLRDPAQIDHVAVAHLFQHLFRHVCSDPFRTVHNNRFLCVACRKLFQLVCAIHDLHVGNVLSLFQRSHSKLFLASDVQNQGTSFVHQFSRNFGVEIPVGWTTKPTPLQYPPWLEGGAFSQKHLSWVPYRSCG